MAQYISTGTYFGRVKIDGKVFRVSLETTDVFTTAKLRLPDFIQKKHKLAARPVLGRFAAARVLYENELTADHSIKRPQKFIAASALWRSRGPGRGLDAISPAKITKPDCKSWASKFAAAYNSPSLFNNTLSTLRMISERAGIGQDNNPARDVKRLGIKPKELHLPEPAQCFHILAWRRR